MKYVASPLKLLAHRSLPVRGAWIEIEKPSQDGLREQASLPVRGAWIEIGWLYAFGGGYAVAPRKGSVD